MAEDGFEVETRQGQASTPTLLWRYEPPRIGLVNPHDAVCDPVELLAWLCSMLKRMPIAETTLQRIEQTDAGFAVVTSRGTVMAEQVLICTATASLLPDYARLIQPNRGQMLSLDASGLPAHERLEFAYYANHGSEYFRQRRLDRHRRRVAQAPRTGRADTRERADGRRAAGPGVLRRAGLWAATTGSPPLGRDDGLHPDHLPIAGPLDASDATSLWICAGFTGHGMSMAHELATQTALAMSGRSELPDLFSAMRFADADAGRIAR